MSLFKFYLGHILGSYNKEGSVQQLESGPLLLYQQQFRALIGEILMQSKNMGAPGPYIPLFYQIRLKDSSFAEV